MGYYTHYTLTIIDTKAGEPDRPKFGLDFVIGLDINGSKEDPHSHPDEMEDGSFHLFGDTRKWYTFDEDMLAISKKWPDLVFQLDGDGEENGDLWRRWYRNGHCVSWRPNVERPSMSEGTLHGLGFTWEQAELILLHRDEL